MRSLSDSKDSVQVSGTGLSPVSLQQPIPLIDIILKLYLYCIYTVFVPWGRLKGLRVSVLLRERPLEPDTDNAVGGNGR